MACLGRLPSERIMNPETPSTDERPPRVPVRIEEAMIAAAMAVICTVSLLNVLVRYFTNASFGFTEEISVFLLVFMAFFGSAVAFARNEQIRISFFLERMPLALRWAATVASLLATLLVFALIVWYGSQFAYDGWLYKATTPGLGIPSWMLTIWLPISAVVVIGRVIGRFIRQVRARRPD